MIGGLAIAALLAGSLSTAAVIIDDQQASKTQEQERPAVVETTESTQANPFLE
jgi:hypothetical protein